MFSKVNVTGLFFNDKMVQINNSIKKVQNYINKYIEKTHQVKHQDNGMTDSQERQQYIKRSTESSTEEPSNPLTSQ